MTFSGGKATKSDVERRALLDYDEYEFDFDEDHFQLETTVVDKILFDKNDTQKLRGTGQKVSLEPSSTELDEVESHDLDLEDKLVSEAEDVVKRSKWTRSTRKKSPAKAEEDNQLTLLEESKLLAELDALMSPLSLSKVCNMKSAYFTIFS